MSFKLTHTQNLRTQLSRLGSGLPCLSPDLGFPEFESIHLRDFSFKAQLSKSVASTIPPRPLIYLGVTYFVEAVNTFLSI